MTEFLKVRDVPTEKTKNANISTENQPEGAARRPSDTLDREPKRDPGRRSRSRAGAASTLRRP